MRCAPPAHPQQTRAQDSFDGMRSLLLALFLAHGACASAADVLYLDPVGNPVDHGIHKFRAVYERHVRPLHPKATFEHRIVPNETPERTAAALKADRASPPKLVFYAPKSHYFTPVCEPVIDWVRSRYASLGNRGDFEVYKYRGGATPGAITTQR